MAKAKVMKIEQPQGKCRFQLGLTVLFVVSLFVLGGDFWDKIRALFMHHAKVKINGKT